MVKKLILVHRDLLRGLVFFLDAATVAAARPASRSFVLASLRALHLDPSAGLGEPVGLGAGLDDVPVKSAC
ncbi:hypothetical protein [Nonomuraea sp. NPDC049784]|uniref:hypothetical protein n=1 Tax=Nonomuraea sp. NPDC049784 TaxID=3154361 RepID=UPI0033D92D24